MELSIENLARAAFPRTAAAQGAKMPRRLLSGIMDAASFPGRTLMAAADATGPTMTLGDIIANQSIPANSTDFLSSMGRTGAMPGRSRVDAISESIIRDPISVLGLGTGSLAKAVGGKVAAATGNKVAPKLASYVADLLANSGTDAASQYATTGAIDPRQMALGAGLGLGMQGLGAGVMKMAPKVTQSPNFQKWFGDSKVVDEAGAPRTVYHGTNADFSEFDPDYLGSSTQGGSGTKYGFFFADTPEYARYWADNAAQNNGGKSVVKPVHLKMSDLAEVYDLGDGGLSIEDGLKKAYESGDYDGAVINMKNDYPGGDSKAYVVFNPREFPGNKGAIKSATGNRGTFDPNDPNITHLTGGGTQLPSLQPPGFAKRLGSRYMNDTTATSGRH